jgi:phosphoribosyl-dephospho-CoA transferase
MAAERAPERHDLVWIRASRRAAVRVVDPARAAAVERWFGLGRPAVARRRDPGMAEGEVALGIVLPAAQGRARIALAAPRDAVARVAPPLGLSEALRSAPPSWLAPLGALEDEARGAGLLLRVYGSLAWQHLSGEAYLRDRSDVDLLAPGVSTGARARALALLGRWAGHECPRLDGELDLGAGRAVAWRELLALPARVLVKSGASVSLEPLAEALGAQGGAA